MTTQERAHFWHEQIKIWRSSGLSGQAFCNQNDLAYHQFANAGFSIDFRLEQNDNSTCFLIARKPSTTSITTSSPNHSA